MRRQCLATHTSWQKTQRTNNVFKIVTSFFNPLSRKSEHQGSSHQHQDQKGRQLFQSCIFKS